MKDRNSIINQKIKERFVEREVIKNASMLISDLQEWEKFDWDEVENIEYKACTDCNEEVEEKKDRYICYGCDKQYTQEQYDTDLDYEYSEVYEWWFVTGYFFEKLREHGQVVWGSPYGYLWGRQTTGQAILLDGIVSTICEEMEIMDGQKYSWGDTK